MTRLGYNVWYDRGIEAGSAWADDIARHLQGCDAFVAFISEHSAASENCLDEIAFAKSRGKPTVMIYLSPDVVLPEGTEMQTARFQRMFYCRQKSNAEFIKNICAIFCNLRFIISN